MFDHTIEFLVFLLVLFFVMLPAALFIQLHYQNKAKREQEERIKQERIKAREEREAAKRAEREAKAAAKLEAAAAKAEADAAETVEKLSRAASAAQAAQETQSAPHAAPDEPETFEPFLSDEEIEDIIAAANDIDYSILDEISAEPPAEEAQPEEAAPQAEEAGEPEKKKPAQDMQYAPDAFKGQKVAFTGTLTQPRMTRLEAAALVRKLGGTAYMSGLPSDTTLLVVGVNPGTVKLGHFSEHFDGIRRITQHEFLEMARMSSEPV